MKKMIFALMSLVLVLGFALPPFNQASAESVDTVEMMGKKVDKITDAEFNSAVKVINEGLYIEEGVYKFDVNRVGETKLTDEQIENINIFYSSYLTQSEIATIHKAISDDPPSKDDMVQTFAGPLIPAALVVAVGVVVAFVGATIAANLIADMYKLAAAGYCKKFKKYAPIKKACKQLGYL